MVISCLSDTVIYVFGFVFQAEEAVKAAESNSASVQEMLREENSVLQSQLVINILTKCSNTAPVSVLSVCMMWCFSAGFV